jgi:hypothetical protein
MFCRVHCFPGNFTCLEVVFVLKRRLGYYLFHTYIPTCLIVIMSVSAVDSSDNIYIYYQNSIYMFVFVTKIRSVVEFLCLFMDIITTTQF